MLSGCVARDNQSGGGINTGVGGLLIRSTVSGNAGFQFNISGARYSPIDSGIGQIGTTSPYANIAY